MEIGILGGTGPAGRGLEFRVGEWAGTVTGWAIGEPTSQP